jgi:DNA-binding MarR family transcriptional regulator
MLKTMEEKGLIFKSPDLVDKRSVRIFLTEEGKRKKEISILTIKQFNEKVRQIVTEEELSVFFNVFEKIQLVIEQDQFGKSTKNEHPLVEL